MLTSPIYKELIISEDASTTALLVNLEDQPEFREIQRKRNQLLIKSKNNGLDADEIVELEKISYQYIKKWNSYYSVTYRIEPEENVLILFPS